VGSAKMMQLQNHKDLFSTAVYVSINNEVLGYFKITHTYRKHLKDTIKKLSKYGSIHLLSGDNNNEQENLKPIFNNNMLFNQTPADKMLFIDNLKKNNKKVAMIGDGLNDAGALKVANIGISITENTAHFTPGSDVIMDAAMFNKLPDFFKYSKKTMQIIKLNFILSLCYNIVGLYFAVQGTLSPLFAAILMPISSISVIVVTTLGTYLLAKKLILNP
jgi:Cu+-exporting ATPase